MSKLLFLLIDDDAETLAQMAESLPTEFAGVQIVWEQCNSFDEALERLKLIRYDMVVTDIFVKSANQSAGTGDAAALQIISQIRDTRFCPIVAFTSASPPEGLAQTSFLRLASKSKGDQELISEIERLLKSGIPQSVRNMHDALDSSSATYLWEFLDNKWDELGKLFDEHAGLLDRLVRRRGAIQLTRLNELDGGERSKVEGIEYYICPPISGAELRLGEVIRHRKENWVRVVMTPHCHLTIQPKETAPRAEKVLTVLARPAADVYNRIKVDDKGKPQNPWKGNEKEKEDSLRRRTGIPTTGVGKPEGRFWFLPGFMEIPASYCDFMEVQSIPHSEIMNECDRLAVLDGPFAESLQSLFSQFYASIGTPEIELDRLKNLMEWPEPEAGSPDGTAEK